MRAGQTGVWQVYKPLTLSSPTSHVIDSAVLWSVLCLDVRILCTKTGVLLCIKTGVLRRERVS